MPYYSSGSARMNSSRQGYGFQYYEQSELNIQWESLTDDFAMAAGWYRQIQDVYMEEIQDAYTQVPEELLPRLTELCSQNSGLSQDEATAFILDTLRSRVSYTLTPGRAPVNEDIVEYFLFESREGYCVHFASAATLMYRLLGIPARYVSGYALQPSDFVQRDDGT